MKQQLFRIYDLHLQRYLTKEDNANISIDGTVNVPDTHPKPEGDVPLEGRFDLAINTGIPDVTGKELYSDDHIVMIIEGKAVICHVGFDVLFRAWAAYPGKREDPAYPLAEFEIGPNAEERAKVMANNLTGDDNPGVRIMKAWEEKAAALQVQEVKAPVVPEAPAPQPEEEAPVKATATKLTAKKLQLFETEAAPVWWRKIPEIAAARPRHQNAQILLKRLTGTEIAVWYIGRGETWSSASDMFLVKEHIVDEPQAPTENEDTNTK